MFNWHLDKLELFHLVQKNHFWVYGKFQTHGIILLVFLTKSLGAFAILSIIHGTAYLVSNIKSRKYKTWSTLFYSFITSNYFFIFVFSRSPILIIFFFALCLIFFITKYRSYILIFTIIFTSLFLIIDDRSSSAVSRSIEQFINSILSKNRNILLDSCFGMISGVKLILKHSGVMVLIPTVKLIHSFSLN